MVRLEHLLAITTVVTAAVVGTVHPDLQEEQPQAFRKHQEKQEVEENEKFDLSEVGVSQRPFGLRVGDDDANAR